MSKLNYNVAEFIRDHGKDIKPTHDGIPEDYRDRPEDVYEVPRDEREHNVVEAIKNPKEIIEPITQQELLKEYSEKVVAYQELMNDLYPVEEPIEILRELTDPQVFDSGVSALDLSNLSIVADGNDAAIWAKDGAQLFITGEGTVHATLGADNYSQAIWAEGEGTTIIINDGYYTNETDGSERGTDLIYASKGAHIIINGGSFEAATPEWTLNCKDNSGSTITVRGGRFYKFNPMDNTVSPEGSSEIIIPEGYEVRVSGDWYVVCNCI